MQLFNTTDNVNLQLVFRNSSEHKKVYKIEEENEKNKSFSTTGYLANDVTNTFSKSKFLLLREPQNLNELLKHEENSKNRLVDEFSSKLVERMRFYSYDQDSEDLIWPIVDDISAESLSLLGTILQNICVKKYDCPNILCAVAKCLCSYDLTQTAEWGPMILLSLLSHKNDNVKEYAVFLLENWKDKKLLPILKNIDCHASWLRAYINSVICSLER